MQEALGVLVADDHSLVRAGFRALLQALPGVQVVAEASDGQEALHLIDIHRPDVALLDITMPRLSGIAVARRAAKQYPRLRIIMLSMHANEEYVWEALQAGACGYLLKDATTVELKLALEAAARGEPYLSPAVSKHVVSGYMQHGGTMSQIEQLTPRQREILQLIAEGNTTQTIAGMLNISAKTVETHRSQLMHRLGLHDVTSLVRFAIRHGLLPLSGVLSFVEPLIGTL
jgi:DNA-binding NarL/FixJ family response regulator